MEVTLGSDVCILGLWLLAILWVPSRVWEFCTTSAPSGNTVLSSEFTKSPLPQGNLGRVDLGRVEEVYIAVMQTVSKWTLDISVLKASAALEMLLELLPRLCPRHRVRFTRPAFSPASLASSSPLPSEINPKKCTLFSPICLVLPPPFPQLKSTSAFAQASQVRYPEGRNKREKLVSR